MRNKASEKPQTNCGGNIFFAVASRLRGSGSTEIAIVDDCRESTRRKDDAQYDVTALLVVPERRCPIHKTQ